MKCLGNATHICLAMLMLFTGCSKNENDITTFDHAKMQNRRDDRDNTRSVPGFLYRRPL